MSIDRFWGVGGNCYTQYKLDRTCILLVLLSGQVARKRTGGTSTSSTLPSSDLDHSGELFLHNNLTRLDSYCSLNKLDLNPSKCSVTTFIRNTKIITFSYTLTFVTCPIEYLKNS